MRYRIRGTLVAIAATFGLLVSAMPAHAVVAAPKVVIIVGPTGSVTDSYRSQADDTAAAAEAAGADVTKVYSPNATWANVKAAVNGANIVVYYGHGNGYPNPYSTVFYSDRVDGWGLNRTTTNGDSDNWSSTMVYCGEDALTGHLTSSSGSAQLTYCSGGPITPAPGWVMIYANACYAPGASEPGNTPATPTEATQRAANFSRPVLADLGASAYYATDVGAAALVSDILSNADRAYGDVYGDILPGSMSVTKAPHPTVSGADLWLGLGSTAGSYKFAFAGNPTQTFSGGPAQTYGGSGSTTTSPMPYTDVASSPFVGDITWLWDKGIAEGCTATKFCPTAALTRQEMALFLDRALHLPPTSKDYFSDDSSSPYQASINRVAAAGITYGCGNGKFCPTGLVLRDQMASFLVRAFSIAGTSRDYFTDDNTNMHQASINAIAADRITVGCSATQYCPRVYVTRGQIAAFLRRGST